MLRYQTRTTTGAFLPNIAIHAINVGTVDATATKCTFTDGLAGAGDIVAVVDAEASKSESVHFDGGVGVSNLYVTISAGAPAVTVYFE
jgi:hypothetical protein